MDDITKRKNPVLTGAIDSPFEKIKQLDNEGAEFWSSRDLANILEYGDYRNFSNVVANAMTACMAAGASVDDHFVEITDMVPIGSGATREVSLVLLSRYACYLVVQNADPSKEIVALGQTYFAIQTRKQEIATLALEEEQRLFLRTELSEHNRQLAGVAKGAGVVKPIDYAIFQDHGYRGLYRMTHREIHQHKGLKKSQKILDHMGPTELAANLFRATQTEEKLKKEPTCGKERANQVHYEVGAKVRQTIAELDGTMPENLPTHDSIKKIERKKNKLLCNKEESDE
ncbi:MAG: DNA damage-inducible protein D [Deltaproteobacteria bacterium]|nr:DNA damage-inducible protein D [Deltaproteobacteria bacterium]